MQPAVTIEGRSNMKRVVTLAVAAAALALSSAASAQYLFCKVTSQHQGVINAGNTTKGLEDYIPVQSFAESLRIPYDAASGQVSGRRQYAPISIIKALDRASPLLFLAAVTNDQLSEVLCKFYRNHARHVGGGLENFFDLKLTNARISSIEVAGTAQVDGGIRETVSFVFEKITWTYNDGNVTAEDDWSQPN